MYFTSGSDRAFEQLMQGNCDATDLLLAGKG